MLFGADLRVPRLAEARLKWTWLPLGGRLFQAPLTSVQREGPTRSTRRLSPAPASESPVPPGPGMVGGTSNSFEATARHRIGIDEGQTHAPSSRNLIQGLAPRNRRASEPRNRSHQAALARETQIVSQPSGAGRRRHCVNPAQGVTLPRTVLAPLEKAASAGSIKSG